jgi:peptidoglycan/LPS O-acetylase OafA/YrhL
MVEDQTHISNRIFGLDFMRTTAILMVLSSHLLWIYPKSNGIVSDVLRQFGFWGVELFFVLSGFLIGRILCQLFMKENFTIYSVYYFLKRRWFRTLPNYFLVLVLNLILAFFIGFSMTDAGYYFFFIQNFAAPMKPFFPESWSLSVEEFAYLLVPFALLMMSFSIKSKNKSKSFIWVVLFLMLLFLVAKIIYNFTTANTNLEQWNLALKAVVLYRIDAILIGIAAGWVSLNYEKFWKKQKNNLAFSGFLLVGFLIVGVSFFRIFIENYPFFWNVLYLPMTSVAFALFLPVLSQWQSAVNPFSRAITFVSLTSYSIYLLHYSILLQLMKHFINTVSFSFYQLHLFTFSYLIITFFLSFLLNKYFEKPIMDFGKKNKNY